MQYFLNIKNLNNFHYDTRNAKKNIKMIKMLIHAIFYSFTSLSADQASQNRNSPFVWKMSFFYRSSKLFITSVKFRGRRRMGSELVLQPRRNGSGRCGQIDVHDSVAESVCQDLTDRVKGFLNALGFRRWARMNYDGLYLPRDRNNVNLELKFQRIIPFIFFIIHVIKIYHKDFSIFLGDYLRKKFTFK